MSYRYVTYCFVFNTDVFACHLAGDIWCFGLGAYTLILEGEEETVYLNFKDLPSAFQKKYLTCKKQDLRLLPVPASPLL